MSSNQDEKHLTPADVQKELDRAKEAKDRPNFSGKNLSRTDFIGFGTEALLGANLSKANLSGAIFSGFTLQDVNLDEANLSDANLEGANLMGASLRGARLSSAKNQNLLKLTYQTYSRLLMLSQIVLIGIMIMYLYNLGPVLLLH